METPTDQAVREQQDNALFAAAVESLAERYKSIDDCNIGDPEVLGAADGNHPAGALRRIKFDALAALAFLMSVHVKGTKGSIENEHAAQAVAWAKDLVLLEQAISCVKGVNLR